MFILRARKVELFHFKNGQETGTEFIGLRRQFYTLLLRRNSEVKKTSSDSESNIFANLSSSSDEDIMEEDVEEIGGQITPYEDELLADSEASARTEENEETDLRGLTPAVLEARYERVIAVSSWFV